MKEFEYLVVPHSFTETDLNVVGSEGWELCTMDYDPDTKTDIYIFKRLIS